MKNVTMVLFAAAALAGFSTPTLADDFADKLASGYQIVGFSTTNSTGEAIFVIQNGAEVLVCQASEVNYTTGETYKVGQCVPLASN